MAQLRPKRDVMIEKKRGRRKKPETVSRNQVICDAFASGRTLAAIGADYGISRERVRQILVANGVSADSGGVALSARQKKVASQEARNSNKLRIWGISLEEWTRLNTIKNPLGENPFRAFTSYRRNARKYGDDRWRISFVEWWAMWEASGLWGKKGSSDERIVMIRTNPAGNFEAANLEIVIWPRLG